MRPRLLLLWGFACLCFSTAIVSGQTIVWSGATSTFVFGSNWVGGVAPGAANTAQFGNHGGQSTVVVNSTTVGHLDFTAARTVVHNFLYTDGVATLTLNGNFTAAAGPDINFINTTNQLNLALPSGEHVFDIGGSTNVLIMGVVSGAGHLSKIGTGTLVLAGANTLNYNGVGGFNNGIAVDGGTLELNGGSITQSFNDIIVGSVDGGNGTLLVSNGGDVTTKYGVAGNASSTNGTITVTGAGSTWTNSDGMALGYLGAGTLNVLAGGTVNTTGSGGDHSYLGLQNGTTGTALVSGAGSSWTTPNDQLIIGGGGTGDLTISAGSLVTNTTGSIGLGATGSGTVTVNNGTWTNSAELLVGNSGTGTLAISNGGDVTNTYSYIGTQAGSNGTVTIDGAGSTWTNSGLLAVGQGGIGSLAISGGATVSNTEGYLGYAIGSNGSATVTGAGSTWTNSIQLTVGNSGTGVLTVADGGTVSVNGGNGTVNLAASGGNGTLNIGGAALAAAAAGGFINAASITSGSGSATVQFNTTSNAGSPYYLTTNGTAGGTTVALTGDTKLVVTAGYTVLQGTGNNYTDTTTINGGTLANANADAFSANSPVEIGAAGNLQVNFTETIGGLNGSGTATLASGAMLTVNNNNSNLFTGLITGAGTLNVTGSGDLTLAGNNTYTGGTFVDDGALILDEGTISHSTNDLVVGHTLTTGSATLDVINGGTLTNRIGYVGYAANTDGRVAVNDSGSQWANTDHLYVGFQGDGVLDITTGGVVTSPDISIGNLNGSLGVVYVGDTGSKLAAANTISVGAQGDGYLEIYDGGLVESTTTSIGSHALGFGGVVAIGDPGSLWMNTGSFSIGDSQDASLEVFDQGAVTTNTASIGVLSGVNGVLEVSSVGSFSTAGNLVVGGGGIGVLSFYDGGIVTTGGNAIVANSAGSSGKAYLEDTGSVWAVGSSLIVGNDGDGLVRIKNSAVLSVGAGTGTITLGAGTGSIGGLQIGYNGEGYEAGGIINASSITTGLGTGTVLLGTNTSKAAPFYLTRNGTGAGTYVTIDGSTNVQQVFGYNVLGGNSTYSGTTTISGGTLVAATSDALGTSNVIINGGTLALGSGVSFGNSIGFGLAGGKLAGDGTFTSPLTLGAGVKLAPGSSPGTMNFASSLTLNNGGSLEIEIRAPSGTPGTDWDFVSIAGAFNLSALTAGGYSLKVISLDLANNLGAVSGLTGPTSWVIATAGGGITGFEATDFAIDISQFVGGGDFTLSQSANDLVLSFTPVPEPSTYALMLSGLALAGLQWRRRRAARESR